MGRFRGPSPPLVLRLVDRRSELIVTSGHVDVIRTKRMAPGDPLIDLAGSRNLRGSAHLPQPYIVRDAGPAGELLWTASFHSVENPDAAVFRLWDELHAISSGPSTFSQSRRFTEMSARLNERAAYELFCWRDLNEGEATTVMPLCRGDIDVGFSLWNRRIATVRLRG
jgi:hypothetical protein